MVDVATALEQYRKARANLDFAKKEFERWEQALLQAMAENEQKSAEVTLGDKYVKATYVQGETVRINEAGLRKALGARVFNRYTVRKVDRAKLEVGIATGEIDPTIVTEYLTINKNKPFIRFTEGRVDGDQ